MEKYTQSDFVARITITRTFPNQGSEQHYKSNIVIHQLFKGEPVKSISVYGRSDGKLRLSTSCDVFFEKGTEMVVYARKIDKGRYIFDSCSGFMIMTSPRRKNVDRELEMLNFLLKRRIAPNGKIHFGVDLSDKLGAFKGVSLHQRFAIFEITFTGNLSVDSVRTISGFNSALDSQLIEILKHSRWVTDRSGFDTNGNEVPPGSKLFFAFYYYPAEGNEQSFISEYDV